MMPMLYIKRTVAMSFFLFFINRPSNAQNVAFLDTVISIPKAAINESSPHWLVSAKQWGDTLRYVYQSKKYIHFITLCPNGSKYFHQENKIKLKRIGNKDIYVRSFDYRGNKLYLLTFLKIIEVDLSNGEILKTINCNRVENIFLYKKYIFGIAYYNRHRSSCPYKVALFKYHLQNSNCIDSLYLDLPFLEYTHFAPNELIDFNGEEFVFARFDCLGFTRVSTDLKNIKTDSFAMPNWVRPSKKLSDKILEKANTSPLLWKLLDEENNGRISRLDYINYLNDSSMILRWLALPKDWKYSTRKLGIAKRREGRWYMDSTFWEIPLKIQMEAPVSKVGFPLMSGNYATTYTENRIYQFKIHLPYEFNEKTSYRDYLRDTQKLQAEEAGLQLWVFKPTAWSF